MASVSRSRDGLVKVQVMLPDGRRGTLYLGRVSKDRARRVATAVEAVASARRLGVPAEPAQLAMLETLSDQLYGKLADWGLVPPRRGEPTLRELIDAYLDDLGSRVKRSTATSQKPVIDSLLRFFGPETPLGRIDPLAANAWRAGMVSDGYARATIARRVKVARTIWNRGRRLGLARDNPFADVAAGAMDNPQRTISGAPSTCRWRRSRRCSSTPPTRPGVRCWCWPAWPGCGFHPRRSGCGGRRCCGTRGSSTCLRPRPSTTPAGAGGGCRCSRPCGASC